MVRGDGPPTPKPLPLVPPLGTCLATLAKGGAVQGPRGEL